MESEQPYLKSQEFLISLIYIPVFLSVLLINGDYEIISAIVGTIFALTIVYFLIKLSIKLKQQDKKSIFRSFVKFLFFNIVILIIASIVLFLIMQNCKGGLCGLSESESILLFVAVQIFELLVYGITLMISLFLQKNKFS
ncbi:MAG TPA: hypothetical protein VJJ52_07135 [Candidatus Nanoarchaeia archaeon]|nr:hypothetical protein [Candidatus Nanoarchaeia archaeon]